MKITSHMVDEFASISGDFNKVHKNEEYAKGTVFKHRELYWYPKFGQNLLTHVTR